jgi:hypothetical protein
VSCFAGPALLRARAVVVGPDDLVEEVLAAEDLVEQELAVVSLAIVDVEVERSRRSKDAPTIDQARLQEGEVVGELIEVRGLGEQTARVAPSAEADPVAGLVCLRREGPSRLLLPVLKGGSM